MKIGTHNGHFHGDDAVAVAILSTNPRSVVRTRDLRILETCDIVVDVGGVYDPDRGRFDHHQEGRAGARDNGVLYSSAGLVWKHYGKNFVRGALPQGVVEDVVHAVWERVDAKFICGVDATDNGQELMSGGTLNFPGIKGTSFSAVVAGMNPTWMERVSPDATFHVAVDFAAGVLRRAVAEAWGHVVARAAVLEAVHAAGESPVVILERYAPWAEHLHDAGSPALFVVFPDLTGTWMCQAVPREPFSFEKRKALPEAWAGKRDTAFQEATGVEDGVFCHPGLFICGAQSREGALRLAALAVEA